MAISRASDSSIQDGLPKFNDIWDGTTATSAFDVISHVTLTSAQKTIEFNNIPQTYSHLQIRFIAKAGSGDQGYFVQLNGDTAANYNSYGLYGNGGGSTPSTFTNNTWAGVDIITTSSSQFSIGIVDILDYANTNKYKTVKALGGVDTNGGGYVNLYTGLWRNTAAVTSITILEFLAGSSLQQYSSFALYGIK